MHTVNGKTPHTNTTLAIILLILFSAAAPGVGTAQTGDGSAEPSAHERALRVFLDLPRNYDEYVKIEIPYVNYVRDRKQAQVHIMMMSQPTGSGGRHHTVTFTGMDNFTAVKDTLTYTTQQMDTDEAQRLKLKNTIALGLMKYVLDTPQAQNILISYEGEDTGRTAAEEVVDTWNYWVFNINTNTRLDGEESRRSLSLRGSVSADRVTPEWKMSFSLGTDYDSRQYDTDDGWIKSITRSHEFESLVVKSLSDHWSAGAFGSGESSTFQNIDQSYTFAPAIEYNVFPYEESTYREFRFLYRFGYTYNGYVEETLFGKTDESLLRETLTATYEIKEEWGSVESTLEGSHYFHDTSKNRIVFRNNINVRLMEGLSVDIFGSVSQIHDQLSLPGSDASEEEILLEQRELATQYDYFASIGLRYTFGSIYSNVVNPRFGNGGRRGGGPR